MKIVKREDCIVNKNHYTDRSYFSFTFWKDFIFQQFSFPKRCPVAFLEHSFFAAYHAQRGSVLARYLIDIKSLHSKALAIYNILSDNTFNLKH